MCANCSKLPESEEEDEGRKVEGSKWEEKKKFILRTLRVYFGSPRATICIAVTIERFGSNLSKVLN